MLHVRNISVRCNIAASVIRYLLFQALGTELTVLSIVLMLFIVHILLHWQIRLAFIKLEKSVKNKLEAEVENSKQVHYSTSCHMQLIWTPGPPDLCTPGPPYPWTPGNDGATQKSYA